MKVAGAMNYARQVVSGERPACQWVKLACQRQLTDLEAKTPDLYFDRAAAQRALDWFQWCRHVKGPLAGQPVKLQPWQGFIVATVYGWRQWTAEAGKLYGAKKRSKKSWPRRFRKAYLEVARKNGKSTLLAGLGLFHLIGEREAGAEVYSAATTRDQARIVFEVAQAMRSRSPQFRNHIGSHRGNLHHLLSASKFEPLSADADTLDGLNTSCALVDELHAHKTRDVLEKLETSTGARRSPLVWEITTAGVDQAGICYEEREHVCQVLQGVVDDSRVFGIIFTADSDDDDKLLSDPAVWELANPNLGVSVSQTDIETKANQARQVIAKRSAFLRYHCNVWVSAQEQWLDMLRWQQCPPAGSIEDYRDVPCWIGLDLADRKDLTAAVTCFRRPGEPGVAVFPRFYLPEGALVDAPRRIAQMYDRWHKAGVLILTEGERLDQQRVEDDLRDDCEAYAVQEIVFDSWNASQLVARMLADNYPMVDLAQTVKNLSIAMKELDTMMLGGDLSHNNDPVLNWNMANVTARQDKNDNLFPNKSSEYAKIDGARALLNALARIIATQLEETVYNEREAMIL